MNDAYYDYLTAKLFESRAHRRMLRADRTGSTLRQGWLMATIKYAEQADRTGWPK